MATTYLVTRGTRHVSDDTYFAVTTYRFNDGDEFEITVEWHRNARGAWRAGHTRYYRAGRPVIPRALYSKLDRAVNASE
jgi:hypothetical protein